MNLISFETKEKKTTKRDQVSHLSGIERRRVIRVNEQNVFRLKIGVRQFVVVQELYGIAQLVSDVTDLIHRIRLVIVFSLWI
jgi:hypothetical protein